MPSDSSPLFRRAADLPVAVAASGCWVVDADGRRYLDAAGGAIVVGIGHGDAEVAAVLADQAGRLAYVHPTAFTTEAVERYAAELAPRLPMDDPVIYPVSGGSEAVETALKAARAFHLAAGEPERTVVIGRGLSYHGNTRGALDVSGRVSLRDPYLPWLGHAGRVPAVLEYRCPNPDHPDGCAAWHAAQLDATIERLGPTRVAAFVAEPIGGAASGAAVPPPGYWEAIGDVCRRHGVLLVADEVMTGFGRTGRWFGCEHVGLRPDLLVAAKGASSGYWPLGVCAMSSRVASAIEGRFVHGFTWSHHAVGAAVGSTVLRRLRQDNLVEAAAARGARLLEALTASLDDHPHVGDVRGVGLLVAVELVADRATKRPFP
ncbi:MAG: aminotransferase class III-fold pyridoxal phosphate-dependent enzyme, partial [Acidimicrobiia bacterium]